MRHNERVRALTSRLRSEKWLLTMLALLLIGSLAGFGTFAVFTATTDNGPNTFEAGDVVITDDDASGVMFALTGLKPGDAATRCIKVTYAGSITSTVHLYAAVSGALAPYLDVTVERDDASSVTPGATHSCVNGGAFSVDSTPFATAALDTFGTDFATGTDLGSWATNATAVFRFTVTYSGTGNNGMGDSADATFTWEAQAGS